VASVELGEQTSGEHTFEWDGKDADGNEADDGQYAIAFLGETEDGESFYASAQVSGLVTSVYQEDGEVMLGLSDGRTVSLANVTKVVDHEPHGLHRRRLTHQQPPARSTAMSVMSTMYTGISGMLTSSTGMSVVSNNCKHQHRWLQGSKSPSRIPSTRPSTPPRA
jgi:hypothetical protein